MDHDPSAPEQPAAGLSAPASPSAQAEPLLRLRPLGFGELLDETFRVYRRHFALLAGISLVLTLPTLLVQLASGQAGQLGFIASAFTSLGNPSALKGQQPPPPNLALLGLSYLVSIVLVPFSVGAISLAAIQLAMGNPIAMKTVFQGVLRRYWRLLGLAGLFVLVTPTLLCFPLFLWFAVRWSVSIPAVLAEGAGPLRALGRSWNLTRGSWWRIFGTLLLVYLLQAVIGGVLSAFAFPVAILVPFVPPGVRGAIILTGSTLGSALLLPVVYLCIVLVYFDLRIRREGFDLDQLARQAVGPEPA